MDRIMRQAFSLPLSEFPKRAPTKPSTECKDCHLPEKLIVDIDLLGNPERICVRFADTAIEFIVKDQTVRLDLATEYEKIFGEMFGLDDKRRSLHDFHLKILPHVIVRQAHWLLMSLTGLQTFLDAVHACKARVDKFMYCGTTNESQGEHLVKICSVLKTRSKLVFPECPDHKEIDIMFQNLHKFSQIDVYVDDMDKALNFANSIYTKWPDTCPIDFPFRLLIKDYMPYDPTFPEDESLLNFAVLLENHPRNSYIMMEVRKNAENVYVAKTHLVLKDK